VAHIAVTTSLQRFLGYLWVVVWRLAADHCGWCSLATIGAAWDIVGTTALAATTTGMTWLAADRGEGLNVVGSFGAVHGRLMAQATFLDPLAWRRC
jgi:hypothetical protein